MGDWRMNKAIVTLKKGEGRMLKSGGAWIFDNEIESVMGNFDDGDIVLVHDFDGYPLGRGFINRHSKIWVRMLTRNIDQEINEAFFAKRLRDAWEYRKKTVDISSCRICLLYTSSSKKRFCFRKRVLWEIFLNYV